MSDIAKLHALDNPDGWLVPDREEFEFLMNHSPPRPVSYFKQLYMDAQSRQVLLLWTAALGMSAAGIMLDQWYCIAAGPAALFFYAWGVVKVVRSNKYGLVLLGVIDNWDKFGKAGPFHTANARLPDGQKVAVGLHRKWATLVHDHSEVLIVHSAAQYCSVFAIRPILMSSNN